MGWNDNQAKNSDVFGKTQHDREMAKYSGEDCEVVGCGNPLTVNVLQFSIKNYGGRYCFEHQKEMERLHGT